MWIEKEKAADKVRELELEVEQARKQKEEDARQARARKAANDAAQVLAEDPTACVCCADLGE